MTNNNKTLSYFVIGHKFPIDNHPFHHTKLLVGNRQRSKIHDHIICKNLKNNIEKYPYLCSYTGWYAVAMNSLHDTNNICLLEHDIETNDLFNQYNTDVCQKQSSDNYVIGYSKTLTDHYVFHKSTPWLEISLKKIYNIDLMDFVSKHKDSHVFWPTTTNITMPVNILELFIKWFNPMTKIFRNHKLGAYVHERAFFIFCVLHNIDIVYAPNNLLIHKQMGSHKIEDIYGQVLRKYNTYYLTDSMVPEYDKLYAKEFSQCNQSI